jgi:hypothetical protein
MTQLTLQQAKSVLAADPVHTFTQVIENVGVLRGKTISRTEAEQLLEAAAEITVNDKLKNIDQQHGISIKQGRGTVFFQTDPQLLSAFL